MKEDPFHSPRLVPLGDRALLVRFAETMDESANCRAVAFAAALQQRGVPGVVEVVPSLVSVLLRFDPRLTGADQVAGEVRLLPPRAWTGEDVARERHTIAVRFDGDDLEEVAAALKLDSLAFVRVHTAAPLRVLAVGFAPGFLYCGFHPEELRVSRRKEVRPSVPAGTVLFAAGQTAIAATAVPTGWHVIGHTDFRNFDADASPPTRLRAGDIVELEAVPA